MEDVLLVLNELEGFAGKLRPGFSILAQDEERMNNKETKTTTLTPCQVSSEQ